MKIRALESTIFQEHFVIPLLNHSLSYKCVYLKSVMILRIRTLQTSEVALAKFPELPQAKSVVNGVTSWMSVGSADEPSTEIQPA